MLKLLALDAVEINYERGQASEAGTLFVSINPDLKTDFGHFLNYEQRLSECCVTAKVEYSCFAHQDLQVNFEGIHAVYPSDSGHYSLVRASAASRTSAILDEFQETTMAALKLRNGAREYQRIILFIYCGSSMLASKLVEMAWPNNVEVVINAFWDFLLPKEKGYQHLYKLSFQQRIRMLSMSRLHALEILDDIGLWFDPIPNPPPLLNDLEACEEVRRYGSKLEQTCIEDINVLVPGLMTLGKGGDVTVALAKHIFSSKLKNSNFVFRDRNGILDITSNQTISVVRGDLADREIMEMYRRADIAFLPYDSTTFRVRTSGALVDCLCFGVIPLVLSGTWLADVCLKYDFGIVLPDAEVSTVLSSIDAIRFRLPEEKRRLFRGAASYMVDHGWLAMTEQLFGSGCIEASATTVLQNSHFPAPSLLAEGNRLLRVGNYAAAAVIFEWLSNDSKLGIYRQNLDFCRTRQGTSPKYLKLRHKVNQNGEKS